jgi:hypothetical protein
VQTLSPTAVRIARALLPLVGVAAPLLALVRIVKSSVNVPYSDDWDLTELAVAMRTGTLRWEHLWTPHNGHRQLVGNLVFLALDRLGGWNVVREELLGVACLTAGLIALHRLLHRTADPLAADAAFAVTAWLIAGPILYESVLISSNIGWPVSTAAFLIAAERLSAPSRSPRDVIVATTAAVIASFAQAPGLLIWPCGVVILLGQRAPRSALVTWCAAWACTVALYFTGYSASADAATARAHSAGDALAYALVFLGTPLRSAEMSLRVLEAIGAAVAVAFALAAAWALRSTSALRSRSALCSQSGASPSRAPNPADGDAWPWIAIGAYALAGSVLTALTRAGLGEYQAMSPRYVSISALLLVATIGLALPYARALRTTASRAAAVLCTAVLLLFIARSEKLGSTVWRDYDYHRGVALQGLARNDPATYTQSYPDPVRLQRDLDALRAVDDGPLVELGTPHR